MRMPSWIWNSPKGRRLAVSKAERRRRDELLVPLEVGRLEDRRVLSAPTITGSHNLGTITQDGTNTGNLVSSLAIGNTGSGIGISAVNNGSGAGGTWQYLSGSTWTAIPTINIGQVFVLTNTDSVRFLPNPGFSGTSASITFYAWDGTGTDQSLTSLNGTDFSSNTETSDIKVNAPAGPTLNNTGGGGTTSMLDDQTTKPFDNAANEISVIESDTSDTLTLTVTLTDSTDTLTDAAGSLSGGSFSKTGTGTYTLSGVNGTQATTALQALLFTPSRGSANTTLTLNVVDLYSQSTPTVSAQVDVTANTTPTLGTPYNFAKIPQGSTSSTVLGTQVGDLILGQTNNSSDGIAITAVDNSNGLWEWSTTGSATGTWTDLSGESASSAFLLSKNDYLRFVPTSTSFVGTSSIQFVAWDGTVGTAHSTYDTTAYPGSGAFSSPSVADSIMVVPTITISGTGTTYAFTSDTPSPFALATITDSDTTDTVTITITQQFNSGATDQLFADGALSSPNATFNSASDGVYTLTGVPIADAQADLEAMTFSPAAGTAGSSLTTKFGIVVSDSLGGSGSDDSSKLVVASPPLLTGVTDFSDIAAETTSSSMAVSALIAGSPSPLGAAVTAVDDSNGTWQYSTNGTTWVNIPITVSTSSAFLLASTYDVRFESTTGISNTAILTLLGWDGAGGTAGSTFNTTTPATAGDFSTNELDATITMYPVLNITGTGTDNTSLGQTIKPFSTVALTDTDSSESVTLTITQITGGSTDLTFADGSLAGTNLVQNTTTDPGTYTLTAASIAAAQTDLRALTFTAAAETAGTSLTTSFQVELSDNFDPTNTVTTSALGTPANPVLVVKYPPVLSGANSFPAEDANTVAGTQVSALIYSPDQVTDPSDTSLGIAVIGLTDNNSTDGTWEYATAAAPTTWVNLPTTPSASAAFLLANGDFVRYVPKTGFVGTPTMTFLAWDGSAGTSTHVDTTYNATTASTLGAFSTASATASITVAPVLSISGTGTANATLGQTITPFSAVSLGDTDSSAESVTITITQIAGGSTDTTLANGSLSGTGLTTNTGGGVGTYTITAASIAAAQSDLRALAFAPAAGTPGASLTTSFQIELSDSFDPTNTVATSAGGTPANQTLIVKSPPLLNGANPLTPEDPNTVTETEVSALIYDPTQVTDSSDSSLGIAVIGLTDNTAADGTWQYSTAAKPTTWIALPTSPSDTAAFLLANTDNIRFLPKPGFHGSPTITFLAWDGSAGTAADVDTTYNATTASTLGAFSSVATAATSTVAVRPVLSITGTGATSINDDQQTTPFDNGLVLAVIGDSNTSESVNVTIVQEIDGAGGSVSLDSTLADGVLAGADLTVNTGTGPTGEGTYTLTGTAAAVTTELQALVFTPNAGTIGQTVGTTFEIIVGDGPGSAAPKTDSNTQVNVQSIASPTLTGTIDLQPLPENVASGSDGGIEVSSLPTAGSSSGIGIAVTSVEDTIPSGGGPVTIGTWDYSTDGTAANPTWIAISGVSSTNVLLLAPTDYIRFLPAAGYVGPSSINFQAWNQFSGTVDTVSDATQALLQRGLSTNTVTASVEVAPVLTIGGTHTSATLDDQTSNPFSGATISDSDSTDPVTITITQIDGTTLTPDTALANGSLTSSDSFAGFSYNSGTGTYTLTADTAAEAQAELRLLVFSPTLHQVAPGSTVTTEFKIQLADSGFGTSNTRNDTVSVLTVTANAIPQLNGANNLTSIPENVSSGSDAGVTVASLIASGKATDSNGDTLGIAITSVDNTNGQWEYSTGTGQPWIPILDATPSTTGVSATSALLLAPTDLVQFFPNTNFFGTATIQFQAWDQTVGTSGQMIDPTALPGAGAFSSAATTATASIQVVAPATITVTTPSQSTDDATPIDPFALAFGTQPGVADPNTPVQTYTVTVTQQLSGGGIDSTLANGSLTGGTFVDNGNGTYTLTGVTAAQATADLELLKFTPTAHEVEPGDSVTTNFTITVGDGVNAPESTTAAAGNEVSLVTTARVDPPMFTAVQTSPVNLPVLAPNGTVVELDAATDVDKLSTITYSITAGNASGAYAINAATGQITVAINAALTYSSSLTKLQVTAINTGDHGVVSTPVTSTVSIALWEVTASATPIAADSSTTLTLTLLSAASSAIAPLSPAPLTVGPLTVAWGDGVTNSASLSLSQPTASLVHFYTRNPNSTDPAAPIPISIAGADVSTQTTAAISGTGVGIAVIPETASSFVEVVVAPTLEAAPTLAAVDQQVTETVDTGVAQSQTTNTSERQVVLRILSPLGDEIKSIPVPEAKLNDLPSLFKKLPDGRYRVYLYEGDLKRLVIDVTVRQGRPVDSSEDSGGEGDRPPTSQTESDQADGLVANPSGMKGQDGASDAAAEVRTAAAQDKQPANHVGQPPANGNQQSNPPNSRTPDSPQNPPTGQSAPAAAEPRGLPGSVALPAERHGQAGSLWSERWAAWTTAAAGAAAAAVAFDSTRTDENMERLTKRSLGKSARLTRRLRKSADVE